MGMLILIMMQIKLVTKEVEISVPLKYLSNFWRTLDIPSINCEVNLISDFVITDMPKQVITPPQGDNPAVSDNFPTNATFIITDTKLCIPVVTL